MGWVGSCWGKCMLKVLGMMLRWDNLGKGLIGGIIGRLIGCFVRVCRNWKYLGL